MYNLRPLLISLDEEMSTARKILTSGVVGVIGTSAFGFMIGGPGGAVFATVIYGAAGAVVGAMSQAAYRMTERYPFLARSTITGLTSMVAGAFSGRMTEIAYGFASPCNGYDQHNACLDTLKFYGTAALPIGMTAVAVGNLCSDSKASVVSEVKSVSSSALSTDDDAKKIINADFKNTIRDGALAGFIAGSYAQLTVGFKEGPVGGLIGGVVDKAIAHTLKRKGFSIETSELLALATTILIDTGGLHFFGSNQGALIPYKKEEDMNMHHLVYYTALMLCMAGMPVIKRSLSFFKDALCHAPRVLDRKGMEPELPKP